MSDVEQTPQDLAQGMSDAELLERIVEYSSLGLPRAVAEELVYRFKLTVDLAKVSRTWPGA